MPNYGCGNQCGCDMNYIGNGDWKCPKCGRIIAFGEPDEDEDDDSESYCNICENNDKYPDCLTGCPYDDD